MAKKSKAAVTADEPEATEGEARGFSDVPWPAPCTRVKMLEDAEIQPLAASAEKRQLKAGESYDLTQGECGTLLAAGVAVEDPAVE